MYETPLQLERGVYWQSQKWRLLTVNGIWGVPPSLLQDFFVKNIGILYAYDFLTLLLKFY